MFNNSDNDSDTKDGHKCSGRSFREVPLANLFKQSYMPLAQDEGFYSGEKKSYQVKSIQSSQGQRK
jgi:hypothetical protein